MNERFLEALWGSFKRYRQRLKRQLLSRHTVRSYSSRLNHFLVFMATSEAGYEYVLEQTGVQRRAACDYVTYLESEVRASRATINTTLSAIDHFYTFLGSGPSEAERQPLGRGRPHCLSAFAQRQFLQAVERQRDPRIAAMTALLLYAGFTSAEVVNLDETDVRDEDGQYAISIRSRRENRARIMRLQGKAAAALGSWLLRRKAEYAKGRTRALFLNRAGKRLTTAGLDFILRRLGRKAGVELSPQSLRNTCLRNLYRAGLDPEAVRSFVGHQRLETSRRYQQAES